MPMDGIVIGSIVYELNNVLINAKIDKIHQPENDEIVLTLRIGRNTKYLLLSASANHPRFYLIKTTKQNPATPPNFCMLLRKHLTGGRIEAIEQIGNERIVKILINSANEMGDFTHKYLIIEIMGKYSNIIFLNDKNIIIDAIKHVTSEISRVREVLPHDVYKLPDNQSKLDPFISTQSKQAIDNLLDSLNVIPTSTFIMNNIVGISKQSAEEIIYKMQSANSISSGYYNYIENIISQKYSPIILVDENNHPIDFLPFPYEIYLKERQVPYSTMSEALDDYYNKRDQAMRIQSRSKELNSLLNTLYDRYKNKRAIQLKTLDECADMDKYRIMGELLTANLYKVQRGAKELTVNNYYSEQGDSITIPLDIKYSPSLNAQRYFKKYNKLKTASKLLVKQIQENESEIAYIESLLTNLQFCSEYDELNEIKEELYASGYLKYYKTNTKIKSLNITTPLKYYSSDNIEILVGKNNKQNDYLTLKIASPLDTWLHAKNLAGSHVIIKRNGNIPEETLYTAAMLAAYYSKGKASSNVSVDYTLCKYVKKPHGAKPGMVIFDYNKTINVTPNEDFIKRLKTE